MTYTNKQLAKALVDACSSDDPADVAKSFIQLLAGRKELHRVREVIDALELVWKEEFGISTIKVDTAHKLTDSVKSELEKIAKGAEIQSSVDKELIGGARLRIDDRIIDGSVSGQLAQLKRALSEA